MSGIWNRLRRWLSPGLMLAAGLSALLFALYWWAIFYKIPRPASSVGDQRPLIRLENAPFTALTDNRPAWSLHAGVIEFDRLPGSALSNIRSANITQITEGKLYALPPVESQNATQAKNGAAFHADKGEYLLGQQSDMPYDLSLLYTLKWKFTMSGNVGFKTEEGMEVKTPQLTLLELQQNGKMKLEQRILCNQGATFSYKETTLHANQTRYNFAERMAECADGVRVAFSEGTLQADKVYWSVQNQQLYCPGAVTGQWRNTPFSAENMTINLKSKDFTARNIDLTLKGSLENIGESLKPQKGRRP